MLDEMDIQILNLLMNTGETITSEAISSEISISSKTIRKRLKNLEDILIKNGARIDMKKGAGISLEIFEDALFDEFRREYMNSSNAMQNKNNIINELINLLITGPDYVKADYLADMLFISKTKLTQSLNDVRTILSHYDLTIESKPYHGLKIVGSEFNYRRFLASNYVQKYQFREDDKYAIIDQSDDKKRKENRRLRESLKQIVEMQLDKHEYAMSLNILNNLLNHLFITIIRLRQGVTIETNAELGYSVDVSKEYELTKGIVNDIEDMFGIAFPEKEYEYIMVHLIGKRVLEVSESQKIPSEVNVLVDDILLRIKEETDIDLLSDFDLRMMLGLHIVPLITRIHNGIELKNPILQDVKLQCIAGYELAIICGKVINAAYHTKLSEHEISYFALHFDVATNREELVIQKKKILVVCSSGRASAQLLSYKFEQLFSRYLREINVCDVNDINSWLDNHDYDYIFTTVPLRQETITPVFEFQFFLNNETVKKIESILNGQPDYKTITKYFHKDLFFSNVNVNTREEALTYLFKKIRKVRELPEEFENLVWERENFFGTDIIKNAALPHPNKLVTEDTFIAVMTLRKSVVWQKNKIRLVILISISKIDSEKYKFLFEWLINLLSSSNAVQRIINEGTYESLVNELSMLDINRKE